MEEVQKLISKFRDDYFKLTGEGVKIIPCTITRADTSFMVDINLWKLLKTLDGYGWSYDSIFIPGKYERLDEVNGRKPYNRVCNGLRNEEKVFRRRVVDFIGVNNGLSYSQLARETGRDHTTVIHSVREMDRLLEQDYYTQKAFREALNHVRENYKLYKEVEVTKEDVIQINNQKIGS